jgi:short-subunit dehydrogenase
VSGRSGARDIGGHAWQHPSTVLITGATGGIGAALARHYAEAGRTLILHGRDAPRLASLTRDCENLGAKVQTVTFDLRDPAAAIAALRSLSAQHEIHLAIANAGVSREIVQGVETYGWEAAREVIAVNLDGAIATVAGVLPEMRQRGRGQIALVSSLAAYFGLPRTPAYCASKAAVKIYGEAMRSWLAPQGIAVNVVLPGFVHTPMNEDFAGAMPLAISEDRAAVLIRRGLERNRSRIAFPRRLAWGMRLLAVLPAELSQRIMRASRRRQ